MLEVVLYMRNEERWVMLAGSEQVDLGLGTWALYVEKMKSVTLHSLVARFERKPESKRSDCMGCNHFFST